jgi:predicted dehydrogenase
MRKRLNVAVIGSGWMGHIHSEALVRVSSAFPELNSERLNEVNYCAAAPARGRGFKTIIIGEAHPFGDHFHLKTGMGIGLKESFLIQLYDFIKSVLAGTDADTPFTHGLRVDQVIEAVRKSAWERRWLRVN